MNVGKSKDQFSNTYAQIFSKCLAGGISINFCRNLKKTPLLLSYVQFHCFLNSLVFVANASDLRHTRVSLRLVATCRAPKLQSLSLKACLGTTSPAGGVVALYSMCLEAPIRATTSRFLSVFGTAVVVATMLAVTPETDENGRDHALTGLQRGAKLAYNSFWTVSDEDRAVIRSELAARSEKTK
jgi:hypothetical protein